MLNNVGTRYATPNSYFFAVAAQRILMHLLLVFGYPVPKVLFAYNPREMKVSVITRDQYDITRHQFCELISSHEVAFL